jgi:hypothetical protein
MARRALAAAVVALTMLGAGGVALSASRPPAVYVHAICTATGKFSRGIVQANGRLHLSAQRTAARGKAALKAYFRVIVGDAGRAVRELRAAGAPAVPSGPKIAGAIVAAFKKLQRDIKQAQRSVNSLPTSTKRAFTTAANKLLSRLLNRMASLGNPLHGLNSPRLIAAAGADPACQAVVV